MTLREEFEELWLENRKILAHLDELPDEIKNNIKETSLEEIVPGIVYDVLSYFENSGYEQMEGMLTNFDKTYQIRYFPTELKEEVLEMVYEKKRKVNEQFFLSNVFLKEDRIKHLTEHAYDSTNIYLEKEKAEQEGKLYYDFFFLLLKWEIRYIKGKEFIDEYVSLVKQIYHSSYLSFSHKNPESIRLFSLHAFKHDLLDEREWAKPLFKNEINEKELLSYLQKQMKNWFDHESTLLVQNIDPHHVYYYYLMTDEEWENCKKYHENEMKKQLENLKKEAAQGKTGNVVRMISMIKPYLKKLEELHDLR